jgi:hypothetical protein
MPALDVTPERPGITVGLPTALGSAFKGFFVPVGQHVTIEMILALKGFPTHRASMLPLIAMG